MTAVDYSVLDNLAGSARSFYPQRHWTKTPDSAVDYAVNVADGVQCCLVGSTRWTGPFLPCCSSTATARPPRDMTTSRPTTTRSVRTFSSQTTGATARPAARPPSTPCWPMLTWCWTGCRRPWRSSSALARSTSWAALWGATPRANWRLPQSDRISGVIVESGRPNLGRFTEGLDAQSAQGAGRRLPRKVLLD